MSRSKADPADRPVLPSRGVRDPAVGGARGLGHRGEQALRVLVPRIHQHVRSWADLNEATLAHHSRRIAL